MKVLRISAQDTYPIRSKMLFRGDNPNESCQFKGDDEDQTFHLGAFIDGQLVSVASMYFEKHPDIEEPYQYQLQGMATLVEHQYKGLSSALLQVAFPIVKQNFCHLVWCNAREEAIGFYKQVGFEGIGDLFDIPPVGKHLLMVKYLDK